MPLAVPVTLPLAVPLAVPLVGLVEMPSWWGLTFEHTLLVLALLLLLTDVFFQSDVPTHIAYVLVAFVVAVTFDVHFLWQAVIGVLAWFALVGFHYLLWRKVLGRISDRFAPDTYRSGASGLVGQLGRVREVDGRRLVALQGDLWRFRCAAGAPADGATVRVTGERDGELEVELVAPSPPEAPTAPAGSPGEGDSRCP
jgi:membrane protein implicated in regulation of membrane protease activity